MRIRLLPLLCLALFVLNACGDDKVVVPPDTVDQEMDEVTDLPSELDQTADQDEVGSVSGSVSTYNGVAPVGARLSLGTQSRTLGATGSYEFTDLSPGEYVLEASLSGYQTHQEVLTLASGEDLIRNIELQREGENQAPVIASLDVPAELFRGSTVNIAVIASDPDGDALRYEWTASAGFVVTAGSIPGTATLTAPAESGVSGSITVVVRDIEDASDTATAQCTTSNNRPPLIRSLTAAPELADPEATVLIEVAAEDEDGDPLSYEWSIDDESWSLTPSTTSAFAIAPNAFGNVATLSVRVSDPSGAFATQSISLSTTPCELGLDCDQDASNGCEPADSGISALCPGVSCASIRAGGLASSNGDYWLLDPNGEAEQVYCEQESDGGGWLLMATVSGADEDRWNEQQGLWSDETTVGSVSEPWLDYKSRAFFSFDTEHAELLVNRRYDNDVRAQVVLGPDCLAGKTRFHQLFQTFDSSRACTASAMRVLSSSPTGLASPEFQEGTGVRGLGSAATNGLCWSGEDTAVNTFKGRFVWTENPSDQSCSQPSVSSGIGVFEHSTSQYENADITATSWLVGTDYGLSAISFFVRPLIPITGSLSSADPGRWRDGSFAPSCNAYRRPPQGYTYRGATGDGIYRIDVDGDGPISPTDVFCDQTTSGGGWTALTANGDVLDETLDGADCYPLITNDPARGCGDTTDLLQDFVLNGAVQAGISWRRMMAIAYGDAGYGDKLGYFAIDFGASAPTTPERIGGTPWIPNGLSTTYGIIHCELGNPEDRIVHYTMGGTYVQTATFLAYQRGTVFGHNRAADMSTSTRATFGFTDRSAHSTTGASSITGIDDYQDGWSCGDAWTPKEARGSRMIVLVR
ncbi:MAG: fibrinogen-like YCDxxxxGGGW domain-containing protein [Myxococcota bacterium]|nr:fibrinogen-like YCDxxxxGGGW domain-containing protein [Myxococcota bacterium]